MTNVGAGKSPSVICKEVFDEGYQPSNEEIKKYALRIGIDREKEAHLLTIARDGLMRALPQDWHICFHEPQVIYYVNTKTKSRQWEHPLDAEYKKLFERARHTHPSTDLSEETSLLDSGIKSLQGTENSDILTDLSMDNQGSATGNRLLAPIERKSVIQLDTVRNNRFEVTNYANTAGIGQIDLNIKTEETTKPLHMQGNKKKNFHITSIHKTF